MTEKDKQLDSDRAVPFTARLMAHYRAQETRRENPLIIDPFAERLAGDLSDYLRQHLYASQNDYTIVRSFFVEDKLLRNWLGSHERSQVVLLGAGLDARAYRLETLRGNSHTVFEVDYPVVIRYKEDVLKDETPLCELVRVCADVTDASWVSHILKSGFHVEVPTFWVLEGLVYYISQAAAGTLLTQAAEIGADASELFADLCIPPIADMRFGPFAMHFKWGLYKEFVPDFFRRSGWAVTSSYADDHDQGRNVGQRGLIFVHGTRMALETD